MLAVNNFSRFPNRRKGPQPVDRTRKPMGRSRFIPSSARQRLAGFGTSSDELLKCPYVRVMDGATGNAKPVSYSPMVINAAGMAAAQAGTDTLQIVYSSSDGVSLATGANQSSAANANFKVKSRYGFTQGDLAIAFKKLVPPWRSMHCLKSPKWPGGGCPGGNSDVLVLGLWELQECLQNCTNGPSKLEHAQYAPLRHPIPMHIKR